jgi:hypothetical protein
MLRNADTMRGYRLGAADGEIGKVSDLYFDDDTWTIRYFVVQTGTWLDDKRVLIAPRRIGKVEADREVLDTSLTREEVEASPPAASDKPVSECMEVIFHPYYAFPPAFEAEDCRKDTDVHLRSMKAVEGYTVAATDGDIGRVAGFILDDADWAVRYVEVDTGSLWPGKHVLVSPEWIEEVDWNVTSVRVSLARATIKDAPEYDRHAVVARQYETDLYQYYGREPYWRRAGRSG